jgi:hypothetical protein
MEDQESETMIDETLDMMNQVLRGNRELYAVLPHVRENRAQLLALHLRNNAAMLELLRTYMNPGRTVVTVRLNEATWLDEAVPIVPTAQQLAAGTTRNVAMANATVCAICQETVASATRLTNCGHCFHAACVNEWFTQNPRCPVCRNDIRERTTN